MAGVGRFKMAPIMFFFFFEKCKEGSPEKIDDRPTKIDNLSHWAPSFSLSRGPGCHKTFHRIGDTLSGGRPPLEELVIPVQPYYPKHCERPPLSSCSQSSELNPRRMSLRLCLPSEWCVGSIASWQRAFEKKDERSLPLHPSIEYNLLSSPGTNAYRLLGEEAIQKNLTLIGTFCLHINLQSLRIGRLSSYCPSQSLLYAPLTKN